MEDGEKRREEGEKQEKCYIIKEQSTKEKISNRQEVWGGRSLKLRTFKIGRGRRQKTTFVRYAPPQDGHSE